MENEQTLHREIKALFAPRKITQGQQRTIEELMPVYGLQYTGENY